MADNTPSTAPGTASPPAAPGDSLAAIRQGFALLVLITALFLGAVAIYWTVKARTLGGTADGPADSWLAGFKSKHVWPVLVWSALFSLAGLAGGVLLLLRSRPQDNQPGPLAWLLALYLLIGGACLLCIPIYLLSTRPLDQAINPLGVWSVFTLGALVIVGVLLLTESGDIDARRLRLRLMAGGLAVGALLFVLGGVLAFWEDFMAGLGAWKERPAVLAWPVGVYLAGLVLMFLSIQPAVPLVRQDQNIRRVVFGANLFVTIFLLLGVLALPNVLAYAEPMTRFFNRPFDWTKTGVNSISPRTRNYLAGQRESIKIYVLLPRNNPVTQDVQTLLENCRSLNSKLTWELISPLVPENQTRIRGFMEKYGISDPLGLLVVVGSEDKNEYSFIKYRDLFEEDSSPTRRSLAYTFKGEGALFNALTSLSEGTTIIYVTTGHGELPLDEPMAKGRRRGGESLSTLRSRLTVRKGVEVRSLTIDRDTKKVPDDAALLIIARPTQPFVAEEVKVLREYAQRQGTKRDRKKDKDKDKDKDRKEESKSVEPGRLILLLEPTIVREGDSRHIASTGLEGFLAEYGVKLGSSRVESLQPPNPLDVIAVPDPNAANPVAQAFTGSGRVTLFYFTDVRPVEPMAGRPGRHTVESLMLALPQFGIWEQTDFDVDPVEFRNKLKRSREAFSKKRSQKPVSVAVAVSDSVTPPGMPRDRAHAAATRDTPRMVVFGTSSWITDEGLSGRQGGLRGDLFNSCLSWLRESSDVGPGEGGSTPGGIKRQEYEINIPPGNFWRLVLLPLALLAMIVVALGTGVWVVRRR